MGTWFVNPAIGDYRLSITDSVIQIPIFDCHPVPVTDYRLWKIVVILPISVTSVCFIHCVCKHKYIYRIVIGNIYVYSICTYTYVHTHNYEQSEKSL